MNRNLSKLLQSLAGVVVLSMANLSMAASYTYDFDADNNERGGQPLNFVDLNVYGGLLVDGGPGVDPSVVGAYAYLDAGPDSGLGVCRGSVNNAGTAGVNKCFTSGGIAAGSDDNLQENEVLGFVFGVSKIISDIGINIGVGSGHAQAYDGIDVLIWSDAAGADGGFKLLSTLGGKITLGFELTRLAVFGSMSAYYTDYMGKIGTTSHDALYVAGINAVPIPAAVWLFGSALLGLTGLRRRKVAV